jgi:hypothetical protein
MATAAASSTSSTAAASGQGADDNYAATGQPGEATTAGGPTGDPNGAGSQGGSAASGVDSFGAAASEAGAPPLDDSRLSEPLRAERRKSNQLEKEIRTLRQQLNRFSEINPEEYSRLQEAERQKQVLEERMELRERQMEEASAQKVAAVASERDEAKQQVLQLCKDRLLERAFSQAEGRNGGDARGDGKDVLEPLDGQGKPLLGDDGRPMTTTEFLDQMRVHPVYGFLFQQRGPAGMQAAGGLTVSGIGSNGEPINPQAMGASEL